MDTGVIIELRNIRKEFPGVVALDNVSMTISKSSIHALLGENGAGKSTLMKILSGTYSSYGGRIVHQGKEIALHSHKDAFAMGISIVSQELNFFPNLTIAESLFLGREPRKIPGIIDFAERNRLTKKWLDFMGLDYDPRREVGKMSVGQKQMIEILKAVSRNRAVIIMDEPTSALTSVETKILFSQIRELKQKGIAFVFISHRLDEVFEICDEFTVLRDGKFIARGNMAEVSRDELIKMMVGRDVKDIYPEIPSLAEGGNPVLEVRNLSREGAFEDVSFDIRPGEILGFAGMMGAGRSEIVRAIAGMDARDSGGISVEGETRAVKNIRDAIKQGIVMVPEDRALLGFVGARSILENIVMPNTDLFSRFGLLRGGRMRSAAREIMDRLAIKAPGLRTAARTLSGGNQQKVVLGKWLLRRVKVLILDEPTRGIDVGAKQEIYRFITRLASEGIAIILISSDMSEVLSMSHRILVIANRRIAGTLGRGDMNQDLVMKIIVEANEKK
jgi:ABC-type sugar transport system ATPase subunit